MTTAPPAAAVALWLLTQASVAFAEDAGAQARFVCEAVYQPAHTVWVRTVDIAYDARRVTAVSVDGVPVHSFAVRGEVLLTSLDNERIQIDTAGPAWTSDFRGVASAQGRCERVDP